MEPRQSKVLTGDDRAKRLIELKEKMNKLHEYVRAEEKRKFHEAQGSRTMKGHVNIDNVVEIGVGNSQEQAIANDPTVTESVPAVVETNEQEQPTVPAPTQPAMHEAVNEAAQNIPTLEPVKEDKAETEGFGVQEEDRSKEVVEHQMLEDLRRTSAENPEVQSVVEPVNSLQIRYFQGGKQIEKNALDQSVMQSRTNFIGSAPMPEMTNPMPTVQMETKPKAMLQTNLGKKNTEESGNIFGLVVTFLVVFMLVVLLIVFQKEIGIIVEEILSSV